RRGRRPGARQRPQPARHAALASCRTADLQVRSSPYVQTVASSRQTTMHQMTRIEVDMNWREGSRTIVIPSRSISEVKLTIGQRVILYEPGTECEAILRRGEQWPWVADIIDGTIKNTPDAK